MASFRVIEQGNGLASVKTGVELWWALGDQLMVVEQVSLTIHTNDSRGNYVYASLRRADRHVTSLSDRECAALPQVLVDAAIAVGDRVEGDTEEDADEGEVIAVDGDQVTVSWRGGGVRTTQHVSALRRQV